MGYPTKQQLKAILDFTGSQEDFMKYIDSIWEFEGFRIKDDKCDITGKDIKVCEISTWGWSGNEDIISVIRQTYFWLMNWQKSERGGHYTFEVDDNTISGKYGLPNARIE